MSDYSTYTDEELSALAGGDEDKSIEQYTDDELMQFVSDEPQQPFAPIEDVSTPEMIGRKARAGLAGAADMAMFGMADEAKAGFQG